MTKPEVKSWTVHLAARQPGRTLIVVVLILLALSAVAMLTGPQWGVGGKLLLLLVVAVLLVGSVAEFLFPVTYTLDAAGAHAHHLGSRRILAWERVRRVYLRPDGIKISPLGMQNWAEAYRGIMLRTAERDAVLADIQAWLARAGISPEIIEES